MREKELPNPIKPKFKPDVEALDKMADMLDEEYEPEGPEDDFVFPYQVNDRER